MDEIGEIDVTVQIKLLRFLGERTFERVGSTKTLTADVRLVAATNKRLEDLVAAAINDAVRKVEQVTQEKIAGMAGGMGLPLGGDFKLPF